MFDWVLCARDQLYLTNGPLQDKRRSKIIDWSYKVLKSDGVYNPNQHTVVVMVRRLLLEHKIDSQEYFSWTFEQGSEQSKKEESVNP